MEKRVQMGFIRVLKNKYPLKGWHEEGHPQRVPAARHRSSNFDETLTSYPPNYSAKAGEDVGWGPRGTGPVQGALITKKCSRIPGGFGNFSESALSEEIHWKEGL